MCEVRSRLLNRNRSHILEECDYFLWLKRAINKNYQIPNMATQKEVGVGDFVLMDKIDIDSFMKNLKLRYLCAHFYRYSKQLLIFGSMTVYLNLVLYWMFVCFLQCLNEYFWIFCANLTDVYYSNTILKHASFLHMLIFIIYHVS